MKLTATIKNFKKNIIGYFNNTKATSDGMLKVIEKINDNKNYYFTANPGDKSNEFPEDSICFIKATTSLSRTIGIDRKVTKPFKFIIVGEGTLSISSLGVSKPINKNELYTFTPITPYEEGSYTVVGKLNYLGSNQPYIKIGYQSTFH